MDGGDVEALDAKRRRGQGQGALQLKQGLVGAVVCIAGAHHVAKQRMAGVSLRRLEQVVLLAALGAVQAAHAAALGGKPLPYHLAVFKLAGDVDLCGDIRRLVVIALDKALYELFFRDVEALVQNELAGALRAALADYKDAGPGDGLLAVEADDVDIHAGWEHHLLAIVQSVDYLEAALDAAGALEIKLRGGSGHFLFKVCDEVATLAG